MGTTLTGQLSVGPELLSISTGVEGDNHSYDVIFSEIERLADLEDISPANGGENALYLKNVDVYNNQLHLRNVSAEQAVFAVITNDQNIEVNSFFLGDLRDGDKVNIDLGSLPEGLYKVKLGKQNEELVFNVLGE